MQVLIVQRDSYAPKADVYSHIFGSMHLRSTQEVSSTGSHQVSWYEG